MIITNNRSVICIVTRDSNAFTRDYPLSRSMSTVSVEGMIPMDSEDSLLRDVS